MKRLLGYFRPFVPKMILQMSVKFTGTVMDLFIPWILSYIIDEIVPLKNKQQIFIWGALMAVCAVAAFVCNVIANRMASDISRQTTRQIRHDLFSKISYLSCRRTDEFTISSLISRLTSDTYNFHQMSVRMQRLGVRAPILLIGGIFVTLTLEPRLALILIAILPILGGVVFFITKRGVPLYTSVQQAADKLVRKVQENMTGVRVIKALSKSEYEKERFNEINTEVVRREQRASVVMSATNPLMNFLLNTGLTLVVVVGAYLANVGETEPGKIIAFLSYFTIILNAMMSITRMFVMLTKGVASAHRITEVLDCSDELETVECERGDDGLHVEFRDVCFSYNGKKENLSNISFSLKRGETLGIVGATGSGKTTVISLLLRFYDVSEGAIYINGEDIRSIERERLHTMFGVVFQNDFILADTVRENIDFGRGLSDEQLARAVNIAQADFVMLKKGEIDHQLNVKGANLSGGQKQRLLIARALAGEPEILVLDDATSALDYATDKRLRRAMSENVSEMTRVIVSQRIASVAGADKILVLDDGKIIGSGRHEELVRGCEEYAELYRVQMGGDAFG